MVSIVGKDRYDEGLGQRMLGDGVTIRCHAVSRKQLRKYRAAHDDPNITADESWPHTQCKWGAEPGEYYCRYHLNNHKSVSSELVVPGMITPADSLPVDLRETYKKIRENPDLLLRYHEMAMLQTRNYQLMEQLEEYGYGPELMKQIAIGTRVIEGGAVQEGVTMIKEALNGIHNDREIWKEFKDNAMVIKGLHETQLKTEKELSQLITREQVSALIENMYTAVMEVAGDYIEDGNEYKKFIKAIAGRIRTFTGQRTTQSGGEI